MDGEAVDQVSTYYFLGLSFDTTHARMRAAQRNATHRNAGYATHHIPHNQQEQSGVMDTNQVATPDPFLYIHLVSHILSYLSLHKHYLARCFQVCKMWHSLTPPFFFKPHLSVAFLGPSQCGKSTLLGHLLYKTGNVKEEVMEDNIRVLEQAPMQMYNKFSMLLDVLKVYSPSISPLLTATHITFRRRGIEG